MAALIDALAKTISLITEIAVSGAEAAFEKAKPTARVYLRSLLITTLAGLLLIPFLVILKAVTGLSVFGYLAAFFAIIFATVLGLLYAPLGLVIGMLAGKTVNPAEAGERYLRFMGPVFFTVLMASLYLARVPWERNVEALPILAIAAAAVVVGSSIWGGWLSGRFYTFVAIVIMSLTTLAFFLPKFFETMAQKFGRLDANMAELAGYRDPHPDVIYSPNGSVKIDFRETMAFPLVANIWSKEMYVPAGEYIYSTDGEWFEYRKRGSGQSVIRLDKKPDLEKKSLVISKGEYLQFRTDANCTARILLLHRR